MRTLAPALVALASSAAIAVAIAAPVRAQDVAADSTQRLRRGQETLSPDALRLDLAARDQARGDVRGVIEDLEGLDLSPGTSFDQADRAAFLLGEAYLELGDQDRFTSLARQVSAWKRESVFTRWLAFELRLIENGGAAAPGLSGVADLARDDAATALAGADTTSQLGRDLAGAALIRLAARATAAGQDARAWLERVPTGSRYAARARHMLGLLRLEHGEAAAGRAALESLLADDSTYTDRRQVRLALAGQALDQGRWESAHQIYRAIDSDWWQQHGLLAQLSSPCSLDTLWAAWGAEPARSGLMLLDARPARARARQLAGAAADLGARPALEPPALDEGPATQAPATSVAPPPAEAWSAVMASAGRVAQAEAELKRARWDEADARESLADQRRYLAIGRERVRGEEAQLLASAAFLDSLRATLASLDSRLRGMRDAERAHVAARTVAILDQCAGNLLWMRAMAQFTLAGPDSARMVAHPAGLPGPDSLLAAERGLAGAVAALAESLAAGTPALLARSYTEAWRPAVIDRAAREAAAARTALAWARSIHGSIDSSLAAARGTAALQRLEARVARLSARLDSARVTDAALRDHVARAAVRRALAALDGEREAIDYGLAASAYGMSVRLGARDSAADRMVAAGASAASPPDRAADTTADAEAARWRATAIPLLAAFLARHPRSPARAEMRFRLADLELTDDREAFAQRMADYTRRQAAGTAGGLAVPVLSHSRALALYRQILDEDRDFPHRDAVLFNAGMILADEGDPGAAAYFQILVSEHPQSPYGQEAWLRMGDMQFDQKRFAASVGFYQHAGAGPDPTLRTIAFYKMGWAHYSEDRYREAADAFGAVLDLYASSERGSIRVEIEGEAQAYLVYSLAGAGGAPAFADYFGRVGARPYERRVLMALGQHYRRYGELPAAAATDRLWMERYPTDADALVIAQRLVETWARSNRPAEEREARLTLAPRFAPGGDWYAAQSADSVRAAGAAFARSSWLSVALDHHRKARAGGSAAEWREAARFYDLVLSHWPHDPDAPTLELGAGEAGAALGDYPAALRHYGEAASAGSDSIAALALWQRVAVTDAWYEHTRSERGRAALGSDSLAHAVIDAGDQLLKRFPRHTRAADIVWRQSQLALAHGWHQRAAGDLEQMASRFPEDPRAPLALSQRGDALFQLGDFEAAGTAFEQALASARRTGRDSLAHAAARAIPVCAYRRAEAAAASDSTAYARNAGLFEQVATRWPDYVHAPLAQYRAGVAYARGGRNRDAVRVMQTLLQRFPRCEFARDARLQIAQSLEALGERDQAALAYVEFAERDPEDESAGPAYLKAADLDEAAGQIARADELRLTYIRKYPGDVETAMTLLEGMARREIAGLTPGHPISTLLAPPPGRGRTAPPPSHLSDYLRRAAARPALASRPLVAQVRFLQGEEAYAAFDTARLRQPLTTSIPAKKRLLDTLLVRYRRAVDLGVSEWAHAAALRIGQGLVGFGDALDHSERPADLHGDDLKAYEGVLADQSRAFDEHGESVWSDLLRQSAARGERDDWTAQAQSALWQRLGNRFLYQPEAEFPLVRAVAPARSRDDSADQDGAGAAPPDAPRGARARAQREGPDR